jgi:acetyltransferase-like isoleucine patch superfamily enzyme
MGAYTYISDSNHRFNLSDIKIREQGMDIGTVEIGSDVWIGRGAMILKDAKIGNRTVVGAGSIVTKKFDDRVVIGGVPGQVVKEVM